MADISKIKTPDGTTYDIKDATARSQSGVTGVKGAAESSYRTGNVNLTADNIKAIEVNSPLFTTNPFVRNNNGSKSLYISKIDNALFCADKRYNVTFINDGTSVDAQNLFDGNYESTIYVASNKTAVITFDFSNLTNSKFPGYPYGYIYVSFYYTRKPQSITGRVYNNYEPHTVGWSDLVFDRIYAEGDGYHTYRARQSKYGLQTLELTIVGDSTQSTGITQIEMWLDRPDPRNTPYLSRYSEQELYYNLTAPKFIGSIGQTAKDSQDSCMPNISDSVGFYRATTSAAGADGHVIGFSWLNADKYGAQLYIDTDPTYNLSIRQRNGSGVWNDWKPILTANHLSTSTSSTSTTTAATSSAVKTAYDLANQANSTANTALSGVNGNLIYDHTFTISNGVATFTPHVYQKGVEVTSNYAASCFTWKYRLIDGSEVSLTTKSDRGCDVTISNLGYGGHVIGAFTPPA